MVMILLIISMTLYMKMKELQEPPKSIINESVMICKLLLVNPVSIAAEGLFRPLEG